MTAADDAYERGKTAYAEADYATAIAEFEFAMQQEGVAADRLDALTYNIALSYLQLGQTDQADAHAARLTTRRAKFDDMRDHIGGGIQAQLLEAHEAMTQADYQTAITRYEAALQTPELAEHMRPGIYYQLAVAHMHTGNWGPAEEYAAAAGPELMASYEQQKATLLGMTGSQLVDDRSKVDETYARARALYDQGDYTNAWAWLQEVDADDAWKAGVTEDINLYKALCALKLGNKETADELAGQLSSNWRETYDEARAAIP